MGGFREFAPGQVWFYYNTQATKALERQKELGAVTCRPVVIVQSAFYPEWNDIITVCPMTHSDRRSGVPIKATILKDGSLVEGGTVLPYLFYSVKTKYLYPMIATNHKRKLLTLSPEDFDKVRQGYLYHLGVTDEVPEYVENWKKLDGYDRNIVVQDIRLAIDDYEDMILENKHSSAKTNGRLMNRIQKAASANPVIRQESNPEDIEVENHLIAALTNYDRDGSTMYATSEQFNNADLGDIDEPIADDGIVMQKTVRKDTQITFMNMTTEDFSKLLSQTAGGEYPYYGSNLVFPGSTILYGVELKAMEDLLSMTDKYKLLGMTISGIVHNTGIKSNSTASRLRMKLREIDWTPLEAQMKAPEPFRSDDSKPNRSHAKKNARRRYELFRHSKEELIRYAGLGDDDLSKELPNLPRSYFAQFRKEIAMIYPNDKIEIATSNTGQPKSVTQLKTELSMHANKIARGKIEDTEAGYELWETLCPAEIREIRSCDKRNIGSLSKNFGITKDRARVLRGHVIQMTDKTPSKVQPTIETEEIDTACMQVIRGDFHKLDKRTLMIFCRTDPLDIINYFSSIKSSNTPSKQDIRSMKRNIRHIIIKK